MMATLTPEQRRRMELNRQRALQLKAQRAQGLSRSSTNPAAHQNAARTTASSKASSTNSFEPSNVAKNGQKVGFVAHSNSGESWKGGGQLSSKSLESGSSSNQGFRSAGAQSDHPATSKGQFQSRPDMANSSSCGSSGFQSSTEMAGNNFVTNVGQKQEQQTTKGQFQARTGSAAPSNSSGTSSFQSNSNPGANGKHVASVNHSQLASNGASSLKSSKDTKASFSSDVPASSNGFSSAKPTSQFYKKPSVTSTALSDRNPSTIKGHQTNRGFQSHFGSAPGSSRVNHGFGSSLKQSQSGSNANFLLQKQSAGSLNQGSKMFGMKPTTTGSCLLISADRFEVKIPYRQDIVECFHKMESKSYDADRKRWTFAMSEYSALMSSLRKLAVPVEIQPLPSSVVKLFSSSSSHRPIQEANLTSIDEKLRDGLLPFQRDGVNFVIHHGGRAMIADDMGLGKTIQAICVACYYRTEWPLLIVAPSSMRYSWAEAFEKWVPSLNEDDIHVIVTGSKQKYDALVNIISYDLMARRSKDLAAQHYQVVIMDESHFLKNYKTARTRAAMPILKHAPRRILLSGTPALSRPAELYMQIQALHTSMFPSFHEFGLRYCDAKQNAWGWDYSGSSNLSELQLLLERKIMIRRLKSDVLSQLPSKTRQKIILDPKSIKTNSASIRSLASAATKEKADREKILEYYAATARLKEEAVRIYVDDLLEGDKKFLVFAHHQSMMTALCEACEAKKVGYIRIDGSTPPQQRFKFCEDFQTKDKYRVAVLSIMAANSGITLTAASLVVFAELNWNPGILMQAEDRAHRIGQSDAVFIHYLIARGTADDLLWPLVQRKLVTLEKAGLSKNDFSEADTKIMKDPKQQSILNFLEQSFCEELSQEELTALDEAETEHDLNVENSENTSPRAGTLTALWKTSANVSVDRPSKRLKTNTFR